jgi:hypothetical protein
VGIQLIGKGGARAPVGAGIVELYWKLGPEQGPAIYSSRCSVSTESESSIASMVFFGVASWLALLQVSTTARGRGFGVWGVPVLGSFIPIEIRNRQIGAIHQRLILLLKFLFAPIAMMP